MLPKLVLVVLMISGRSFDSIEVQYTVQFSTEAQCNTEADKINKATDNHRFISYPFKRAQCTFNLTK